MRRLDPRLIFGGLLILGGLLALLDTMGIIRDASGVFWGVVFGAIGAVFLYVLVTNPSSWWAAFPAFTLLGMSLSSFLPNSLEQFSGLVFLGGIGLSFWVVYAMNRAQWWAIIPGGVLVTLGIVSAMDEIAGINSGGVLFIGLGITFLLVAMLPSGRQHSWGLIPGVILLIMGWLMTASYPGLANYIWPVAIILAGGFLVWNYFRR